MTPKDRLALSAYIEMLDDTVDLRNDSISMNGGDPVRLLLSDRDEIESDRDRLRSELDAARAELARVRAALTPSAETKALHIGEYKISVDGSDEDGNDASMEISVPWTTVKEIMKRIRESTELARMGEP